MISEIKKKIEEAKAFDSTNPDHIEKFRIEFIGKNGHVGYFFKKFKSIENKDKKAYGLLINELKKIIIQKVKSLKLSIKSVKQEDSDSLDLTLPSNLISLGSRHPISIIRDKIIDIFCNIGYLL